MKLEEEIELREQVAAGMQCNVRLKDDIVLRHARCRIAHRRATNWIKDPETGLLVPDPSSYVDVDEPEEVENIITDVGLVWIHTQCYGTSGLSSNGLNYIALSNDALTETAASTALSNEIVANGLARTLGTVTLPTGSGNQTIIDKTFTCATAAQSAQKAALFNASSAGTMQHPLAFTQRPLQVTDTIRVTYTLTLG